MTPLVIADASACGKGVFSSQAIRKGNFIYLLDGVTITLGQLVERVLAGSEAMNDPLQIGKKTYLDLDDFSRTFNHSCDPNAGLRKRSELFALRDIEAGEQITFDYSATVAPTEWSMECMCGSTKCRKIIRDIRSIPRGQLQIYKKAGAIQRYMKPLLKSIEEGVCAIPDYELKALRKLGY